jgi:hypothetical protein
MEYIVQVCLIQDYVRDIIGKVLIPADVKRIIRSIEKYGCFKTQKSVHKPKPKTKYFQETYRKYDELFIL